MATARCTAAVAGAALFTVDLAHRGKLTNMTIDNQAALLAEISLVDTFTPNASVGTPTPAPHSIIRKVISVPAGLSQNLSKHDLKDVDVFGALTCVGSITDAACVITVGYHEE